MMQRSLTRLPLLLLFLALAAGIAVAQYRGGRSRSDRSDPRLGVPEWEVSKDMPEDVFTFVRIRYDSYRSRWRGRGDWRTDHPDADLNISYRLQELTSLKVHPEGVELDLTDPELFNYPFIYIVEPGNLVFRDEEVKILRQYLLTGGFLMFDDFWGEAEYENVYDEMKRVFPEHEPKELPLEHPIFHIVFPLNEKPQIPNVRQGIESQFNGVTWERPDAREVHYQGIFDDQGRMMVILCHNTDLGDGWEREGDDHYYFKEFSEKKAYPLGINILVYAMTH